MTMFPDLNEINENADAFSSQEFSPTGGASMPFSIQAKTSEMTDKDSPTFTVMGSNLSKNVGDMVNVSDSVGRSGPFAIGTTFEKAYFPYKYIGVQYTHNSNSGVGKVSIGMEQRPTKVAIA